MISPLLGADLCQLYHVMATSQHDTPSQRLVLRLKAAAVHVRRDVQAVDFMWCTLH